MRRITALGFLVLAAASPMSAQSTPRTTAGRLLAGRVDTIAVARGSGSELGGSRANLNLVRADSGFVGRLQLRASYAGREAYGGVAGSARQCDTTMTSHMSSTVAERLLALVDTMPLEAGAPRQYPPISDVWREDVIRLAGKQGALMIRDRRVVVHRDVAYHVPGRQARRGLRAPRPAWGGDSRQLTGVHHMLDAYMQPARLEAFALACKSAVTVYDSTLHRELVTRAEGDQAMRLALMRKQQQGITPDSLDVAGVIAVDQMNTTFLRRVVAEQGWPGKTLVGTDGADAAFLLVQHADRDTAFQAQVLPLMERAFVAGQVSGQHLALLTDRLAVERGRPQVFGSQADVVAGHVILKPIADSAGVDARRARVGLPPLAEYVRVLDSLYAPRKPQ